MKASDKIRPAFRYRLDRAIRALVMRVMNRITPDFRDQEIDIQLHKIKKILIVRSIFRMGDAILATPAILLFRSNFPAARIDLSGRRISKLLFENLPIDRHYEVYKGLPWVVWSYVVLLKRLRETQYDLAFDASGSSAALGVGHRRIFRRASARRCERQVGSLVIFGWIVRLPKANTTIFPLWSVR